MEFEKSTQATCWMFDKQSLMACKEEAAAVRSATRGKGRARVRKTACGFHDQHCKGKREYGLSSEQGWMAENSEGLQDRMSSVDQDVLVHFHAHQIQRLIGPNAIFPELRRTSSALSTAIMLFRRFYLSNSVINFHPRNIAAASALLAVKVECETRLEISILAHATSMVNRKAQKAPLCRDELRAVSVEEIEDSERELLAGLDFRLRCHHPYGAIHMLASEIATSTEELRLHAKTESYGYQSPRSVHALYLDERLNALAERAAAVAQSALVYTDINFLYPPGKIAFAAIAIALEGRGRRGQLGCMMRNYVKKRFPKKTQHDLADFEADIVEIIETIEVCPDIDLTKFSFPLQRRLRDGAEHQAVKIRRAFSVAARLRNIHQFQFPERRRVESYGRKRSRVLEDHPSSNVVSWKVARVTPHRSPIVQLSAANEFY